MQVYPIFWPVYYQIELFKAISLIVKQNNSLQMWNTNKFELKGSNRGYILNCVFFQDSKYIKGNTNKRDQTGENVETFTIYFVCTFLYQSELSPLFLLGGFSTNQYLR